LKRPPEAPDPGFREHPRYDASFIADAVRAVYGTRKDHGEIRRVNINAARWISRVTARSRRPGSARTRYSRRPTTRYLSQGPCAEHAEGNYLYRLDGLSRAMEGGCDDVGSACCSPARLAFRSARARGARHPSSRTLWRGPHTISFPASGPHARDYPGLGSVSDAAFRRVIATLRLAVPYTG